MNKAQLSDSEQGQNAMLERLWRQWRDRQETTYDGHGYPHPPREMTSWLRDLLRELLQAVQERDAQIVNEWRAFIHLRKELVGQLKAQTYADLFMEEK